MWFCGKGGHVHAERCLLLSGGCGQSRKEREEPKITASECVLPVECSLPCGHIIVIISGVCLLDVGCVSLLFVLLARTSHFRQRGRSFAHFFLSILVVVDEIVYSMIESTWGEGVGLVA